MKTIWLAIFLLLGAAEIAAGSAADPPLWIQAADARAISSLVTQASAVGLQEPDAFGDFLVPMVTATPETPAHDCWIELSTAIPKSGSYWFWGRVRFPAGPDESFHLDLTDSTNTNPALILAPGPEPHRWHWIRAGPLELAVGPFVCRIRPHRSAASTFGPLHWRQAELTQTPRLNLMCLTADPDFVPTDDAAAAVLRLSSESLPTPCVVPAHLDSLPANQSLVNDRKPVPDWMRCPRWFTKDSWRDELLHRQAGDIAAIVREVAANGGETLRLSCFWGGEAYFQSRVAPHAPGLGALDYLREALDEAARTGGKVVVYMNPNALCLGHPLYDACVIRAADGQPSRQPAYGANWRPEAAYACIHHPRYRQFLKDVLTEIFTRYGPAGLYVDGLTPHVCFCEHCRAKWLEWFGAEMPADSLERLEARWAVWGEFGRDPQPVGDVVNDPLARRLTEMMRRTLVEVTREFRHTVQRAKPDAVTLFHSHPKPDNDADYDGTLTEVYSPRPWVHTAWRSGELAGYSAVYPVPVLFNVYPHRHFTAAEARYHALQGLANGAYPNFWSAAGMKPVFDYMRRCARQLDFNMTAPVKFIALPRDLRESDTQRRAAVSREVAYASGSRFLAPYVGAYSALMRAGLPVVTLQRPHFEDGLDGFQVLVLANVALLSDAQAEAVRRFVRDGGGLVATHETSLFDEAGRRRADFAMSDVLGIHYQNTLPAAPRPVSLEANHPLAAGLPQPLHLIHDEPVVAVSLAGATRAGAFADGHPALLVRAYGRGRIVYMPGRFDSMQCDTIVPAIERLFANAIRWAAPDRSPIEIRAAGPVGVTLFRQPRRLIAHLVNHQRDSQLASDAFAPLRHVSLDIALPEDARNPIARRLWADCDLVPQVHGRTLQIELGTLDEYEAVSVEW